MVKEIEDFVVETAAISSTQLPGQWVLTLPETLSSQIYGYLIVIGLSTVGMVLSAIRGRLNIGTTVIAIVIAMGIFTLPTVTAIVIPAKHAQNDVAVAHIAEEAGFEEFSHNTREGAVLVDGDGSLYSFEVRTVDDNRFYTLTQ